MPTKPTYKRPGYLPKYKRDSSRENMGHYLSRFWRMRKRQFWAEPNNQYCKGVRADGQPCMKPRARYFQVDHIKPLPVVNRVEFMELSELIDLQALCPQCHARKTLRERRNK